MSDIKGTEDVYMMLRHHQMSLNNQLAHFVFIRYFLIPLPASEDGFKVTEKAANMCLSFLRVTLILHNCAMSYVHYYAGEYGEGQSLITVI